LATLEGYSPYRRIPFAATLLALLASAAVGIEPAAVRPLANAHAHNDYLHSRPLLDALDHGFTSVEADIFLVDGKLLVAHEKRQTRPERTLEALYLDPLRDRVRTHGGSVYPNGDSFTLLIDIKSGAEATYETLAIVLARYADVFSVVRDGKLESKAVTAVISGNRPMSLMATEKERYAGVDGRLGDLDSDAPADYMPLVSDNWATAFKWRGRGPIGDADREKLTSAVAKAHAHGRKIRFWATPETLDAWHLLAEAGVDMINTDDLAGLEKFLRGQRESK
jgi:glycerophosphoryl diester phosphodiesterase